MLHKRFLSYELLVWALALGGMALITGLYMVLSFVIYGEWPSR